MRAEHTFPFALLLLLALLAPTLPSPASAAANANAKLVQKPPLPGTRHEHAVCNFENKIFAIGGRRKQLVYAYDDVAEKWDSYGPIPSTVGQNGEVHHFQCAQFGAGIVVAGALTGGFPAEDPLSGVYLFKPKPGTWVKLGAFPKARDRGSTGTFVKGDRICFVNGNTAGHGQGVGTTKKWFDCFSPGTGEWAVLPDTSKRRDHGGAVLARGKAYVAGGRDGGQATWARPEFGVREIEEFNFKSNKWKVVASLVSAHPGMTPASKGAQVFFGDGELGRKTKVQENGKEVLNVIEAYHTKKRKLVLKGKLPRFSDRHGSGYAVCKNVLFTVAGAQHPDNVEFSSVEAIFLNGKAQKCTPTSYW